ncbi:MAG: TraR/DksA C4-type zinc finger protein [Desulfotomaculaceae bacterium]|nr:TraR/DksA C4-type zinc finger protein [Desulfotomaculaceae bacterium]
MARVFDTLICAECGEPIMEPRARLKEGRVVCRHAPASTTVAGSVGCFLYNSLLFCLSMIILVLLQGEVNLELFFVYKLFMLSISSVVALLCRRMFNKV